MGIYIDNYFVPAVNIKSAIIPSGTTSISVNGLYDVAQFSSVNVNIKDLLDNRITSTYVNVGFYEDLSATKINPYAFGGCTISGINMPNVTTIGDGAFYNVVFPLNTTTELSFPKCTYLGSLAFSRNTFTTGTSVTLNLPICSYIGASACCMGSYLLSVTVPLCEYIDSYAFSGCSFLKSIVTPICTSVGSNAFRGCSELVTVSLPICSYFGSYAFGSCRKLPTVRFSSCTYIGAYAFSSCYNLLSVYLNVSSVPSLANVNAFTSTPISTYTASTGGVYGSIFVPTSLYSSFISATNWTNYSSRIVSMNF